MSRFDTIIVPVDGSPRDQIAVPTALDEALRHDSQLVLLYVVERPEPCQHHMNHGGPLPVPAFSMPQACAECTAAWHYLEDLVREHHLPPGTQRRVRVGETVQQVETETRCHKRPLVVMTVNATLTPLQSPYQLYLERLIHRRNCELLIVTQPPPLTAIRQHELIEIDDHYAGTPL